VSDNDGRLSREDDDEEAPSTGRLLALTDGVVAIALTLLVLQLQVPVSSVLNHHSRSASDLWRSLGFDRDEFISYLIAFLVIAQFWLVHHRILRSIRGHHEGLAWRNFGFLLALTLMPFTSDLLGRYGENPVAVTLFGINLAALSLGVQWVYRYAAVHDLILDQKRSSHDELLARARAILVLAVIALAIILAWTASGVANDCWLILLVTPLLAARLTAWIERRRIRRFGLSARE
jgi:uncharacterized membrane protein